MEAPSHADDVVARLWRECRGLQGEIVEAYYDASARYEKEWVPLAVGLAATMALFGALVLVFESVGPSSMGAFLLAAMIGYRLVVITERRSRATSAREEAHTALQLVAPSSTDVEAGQLEELRALLEARLRKLR